MCNICKKPWKELESRYPCGPCPKEWICPDCGANVSPCCGAIIMDAKDCDSSCKTCKYCGDEVCSKCGGHCHCGGCI